MGWSGEDEWLSKANEDLAEHGDTKGWLMGARASIADPIAEENQDGSCDD